MPLSRQVGSGQEFVVQHATGHGGDVYWVLLHGSNESWLSDRNFVNMVQEYIRDAPAGNNMATNPRHQRYHGVSNGQLAGFNRQDATLLQEWYNGTVAPSDPNYMSHRMNPTQNLFRYKDAKLAGDRYVSYASERHPWIESAWRYNMVGGPAFDFDTIRATVPGRAGPGHCKDTPSI